MGQEIREIRSIEHAGGVKSISPHQKNSVRISKKYEVLIFYESRIPLLGKDSGETLTHLLNKTQQKYVHGQSAMEKMWKQRRCTSPGKWINCGI